MKVLFTLTYSHGLYYNQKTGGIIKVAMHYLVLTIPLFPQHSNDSDIAVVGNLAKCDPARTDTCLNSVTLVISGTTVSAGFKLLYSLIILTNNNIFTDYYY